MKNHDATIKAMLADDVIERLGLLGRDPVLQVTRLCDEVNRLLSSAPRAEPDYGRRISDQARDYSRHLEDIAEKHHGFQ